MRTFKGEYNADGHAKRREARERAANTERHAPSGAR